MKRLLFISCAVILIVFIARGQNMETLAISVTEGRDQAGALLRRTYVTVPATHAPVVIDRPFSAVQLTDSVQVLPDGTQLRPPTTVRKLYRDSQGRTRIEWQFPNDRDGPVLAELNDPLAGRYFFIETGRKIAHRVDYAPMPRQDDLMPSLLTEPSPSGGAVQKIEPLGPRMIGGLETSGVRTTTTFPVGSIDNNRPVVRTRDLWTSPALRMWLSLQISDPRLGDYIARLTEINREEPEPSLFHVPPEYFVKNETASFVVQHGPNDQITLPVPVERHEAKYTKEAQKKRIQGSVLLEFFVDEKGVPQDIRVKRSLDPGLDKNAVEAVKTWRFQPGTKEGKPIKVVTNVEVSFRLL